jgi:hypothetical protein
MRELQPLSSGVGELIDPNHQGEDLLRNGRDGLTFQPRISQ